MYNAGVMYGKFLPPHRGHLNAIINSATKCRTLYVVVSDNKYTIESLCNEASVPVMDMRLRAKWLSIELQDLPHIKVLMLDESHLAPYPHAWKEWASLLEKVVPEKFDVIFGGELDYAEGNKKYFPYATYEVFDYPRSIFPISGTEIRNNPYKHWDYILGSARGFFSKKVLITGTESCGKTTLTKYLAKTFYTSWSNEVGRYYASKYLGGSEELFTDDDFLAIAYQQRDQDEHAIKTSNKIVFFDTDALVTEYYSRLYMGHSNSNVIRFIDPSRYDLVFLMTPSVEWVADGQRRNGESEERIRLHEMLYKMYLDFGFDKSKIIEIDGDYATRFKMAYEISKSLISHS